MGVCRAQGYVWRMGETHRHEAQIYQLRAVLSGISPLIWRRLLDRWQDSCVNLPQRDPYLSYQELALGWRTPSREYPCSRRIKQFNHLRPLTGTMAGLCTNLTDRPGIATGSIARSFSPMAQNSRRTRPARTGYSTKSRSFNHTTSAWPPKHSRCGSAR